MKHDGEDRPGRRAGCARSGAGRGSRGGTPGSSGARSCRCRAGPPAGTPSRTGRASAPGPRRPASGWRPSALRAGPAAARTGVAEQRDPEVLWHVARILRGPVGVVAEGRIADALEPIEVVVGRVEDLPGRDDVVERPGPRSGSPRRARPTGRGGASAARPDEREERRPEDDRQARRGREAEQQAGERTGAARGEPASARRWPGSRRHPAASASRVASSARPRPPRVGPEHDADATGRSARPRRCAPGTRSSRSGR